MESGTDDVMQPALSCIMQVNVKMTERQDVGLSWNWGNKVTLQSGKKLRQNSVKNAARFDEKRCKIQRNDGG